MIDTKVAMQQALAFVERVTSYKDGGPDRHDTLIALHAAIAQTEQLQCQACGGCSYIMIDYETGEGCPDCTGNPDAAIAQLTSADYTKGYTQGFSDGERLFRQPKESK